MNSNLIPTSITDKNGKLTTVYKKSQPLSKAATMSSIGMPVIKVDESHIRKAVAKRVIDIINSSGGKKANEEDRDYVAQTVEVLSPRGLHNVNFATKEDGDLAQGVANQIIMGEVEGIINETIHFYRLTGSWDYWRTAAEVRALGHYPILEMYEDLSKEDEIVQEQCLALMKVARIIDTGKDNPSPYLEYMPTDSVWDMAVITNDHLSAFIAMHPESAEEIARIITKYDTDEPTTIEGIMNGILPALADGSL